MLIIGSGFSGLGMAIKLKAEGIEDFVIAEKADSIGGTWRENTYPGCACDVPSHMYSFSFEPNPDWSEMYAPQEEIRAYLERCADAYDVRRHVSFGTKVVAARWDEAAALWRVDAERAGKRVELTARYVCWASGGLHVPAKPALPGLERFRGRVFHSAEWDHDFDPRGKRIAALGTGASAIQFVPEIAPHAERLDLYQRTAPWVLPKVDRRIPKPERRLYRRFPALQRAYRWALYAYLELVMLRAVRSERFGRAFEALGRRHLARQVSDPDKRRKLTPRYEFGCKRILMSNDYYAALDRPNAEVLTDPIEEVTERGIVAGGVEREADAIILGTGFDVNAIATAIRFEGQGGRVLTNEWSRDGIQAHRGTMVAGYPNLFFLLGPNTGLGHNSVVFMAECQIRLAVQAIRATRERGALGIAPRRRAQAAYNERLQRHLRGAVWSRTCKNWYLDAHGRNVTIWPFSTARFWAETARLRPREYALIAPAPAAGSGRPEPRREPAMAEAA